MPILTDYTECRSLPESALLIEDAEALRAEFDAVIAAAWPAPPRSTHLRRRYLSSLRCLGRA